MADSIHPNGCKNEPWGFTVIDNFPAEATMTVLSLLRRHRRPGQLSSFRDAFVLSGGGSLGAIQVGALQALMDAGVRPDVLVGCSVGALNAAFLAVDPSRERLSALESLWLSLDRADVFPASRRSIAGHLVRRDTHLYEPHGLRELVDRLVHTRDLADLAVPIHIVTTDLYSGQPVWWTSGDPRQVLVASASLPGLFPPVELAGSLHVDGGVTCPVPVQRAVELGAERIWVFDVTGGSLGRRDERMTALDVLLTSFAISRYRLASHELPTTPSRPIIPMPRVELGKHELRDFSRTSELIELGRSAGARMVQQELTPTG
jgi:NTE family protein